VSDAIVSPEGSAEVDQESSSFPHTPIYHPENENERENGGGRGKRNSPEPSGEEVTSPSPAALSREIQILHRLTECFKREWGRVPAHNAYEVILREPTARESAQLRDLARELSATDGWPLDNIDQAFREAAGLHKFHISYARAVLLDWLGVTRNRSPQVSRRG
jgi:hypothetical protein